jgi:hypothetical protein
MAMKFRISEKAILVISLFAYLPSYSFNKKIYSNVINKYDELHALEDKVFNKLIFVMSPKQISLSMNYKLMLRDQLGRDWLFKANLTNLAEDGPIAVYRWFKMKAT